MTNNHDDQSLQEEVVRGGFGSSRSLLGRSRQRRETVDELDKHNKERELAYHRETSVSFLVEQPDMMQRWPRVGQVQPRPFEL
jgi:hypothetical protein